MPLARAQSVLKKVLPAGVFDWLYRVATAGYYTRQRIADWLYYNLPKQDAHEQVMVIGLKAVLPYTMVGRRGLIATYKVVQDVERRKVKGCFVECGVARGGSAILMLLASEFLLGSRESWLFDSFEGLPEPTAEDGELRKPQGKDRSSWDLAKGYCLGTQEGVEELLFGKFKFDRGKVHLVKGWFQDTLPEYRERVGDIAVLRIDGDWYESTKCCLENLYDNVVVDGYVILDDYALVGCRKAVEEFFEKRGEERGEEIPKVIPDGRGGGWFRKGTALCRKGVTP